MPELPEVETVARQLAPILTGRTVLGVEVFDPKLSHCKLESLVGSRFLDVVRVGKQVALIVDRDALASVVLIHLRMSGRLLWHPMSSDDPIVVPEVLLHSRVVAGKHIRFRLQCSDGTVEFIDPRRFGTCAIYPSLSAVPLVGVEPLGESFSVECLTALLKDSRQPLKPWLLRQDRIVGLGNIYASEILFRAGLSPFRAAGSLENSEIRHLYEQIRATLLDAIAMCGTTFSDFQQSNGESGGFQRFLTVYERESQPCRRCDSEIVRSVQAGRSSYHCRRCQA